MSSMNAVAAGNAGWAMQVKPPANEAVKHVDRDGDQTAKKPDAVAQAVKDTAAPAKMLDIKA